MWSLLLFSVLLLDYAWLCFNQVLCSYTSGRPDLVHDLKLANPTSKRDSCWLWVTTSSSWFLATLHTSSQKVPLLNSRWITLMECAIWFPLGLNWCTWLCISPGFKCKVTTITKKQGRQTATNYCVMGTRCLSCMHPLPDMTEHFTNHNTLRERTRDELSAPPFLEPVVSAILLLRLSYKGSEVYSN